ncbi:MAG: hypothetical protein IKH21_09655, partial [Clostridia bacterium]|nr:hypothetical protein [Clostridia bacterium]
YSKSHISLYFLPVLTAESSLSQCKFLPLPMVISTASPLWNLLWEFTYTFGGTDSESVLCGGLL